MKCINPNCGGEWTPPPGKSVTVCPFCGEPVASEKKPAQSFDNVADTLSFIVEQYSADTLLSGKVYSYFADLTYNQLRDETDLIKQLCEKGALDCLKAAIGKPGSEQENAIKRALSKLPKYLQDSPAVEDMLRNFAAALGWKVGRQKNVQQSASNQPIQPKQNSANLQSGTSNYSKIIGTPLVGSVERIAGIDWRVLAVENNKALLISEKILEKRPYNVEGTDITWENCTLRKYLNGEFYNSLGAAKSAIIETNNWNPNNPWYGTPGGNATTDKVFLLSLDELVKYFGDCGKLCNQPKNDGRFIWWTDDKAFWIDDQYNHARIAYYRSEGASWWWLRSPGDDSYDAAYVDYVGNVYVDGYGVDSDFGGVRPALWLNL